MKDYFFPLVSWTFVIPASKMNTSFSNFCHTVITEGCGLMESYPETQGEKNASSFNIQRNNVVSMYRASNIVSPAMR